VKVTVVPAAGDGFGVLPSVALVETCAVGDELTVCDSAELLDAVFAVSPEYVAMML
jgi:hypothetical protein